MCTLRLKLPPFLPFIESSPEMPRALRRTTDSLPLRASSSSVHSDFRRIKPEAARRDSLPGGESGPESAEFREAIAYMKGVADAMALVASAPPEAALAPSSRRITIPYEGPPPSTFEEGLAEPGSGVRLKAALPCPELYDLAGIERSGTAS